MPILSPPNQGQHQNEHDQQKQLLREKMTILLEEFRDACRRPLFYEIVTVAKMQNDQTKRKGASSAITNNGFAVGNNNNSTTTTTTTSKAPVLSRTSSMTSTSLPTTTVLGKTPSNSIVSSNALMASGISINSNINTATTTTTSLGSTPVIRGRLQQQQHLDSNSSLPITQQPTLPSKKGSNKGLSQDFKNKTAATGKKRMRVPSVPRTWTMLLSQAAELAPFWTTSDYTELLRLASITTIGFLLHSSTGNESMLLEHVNIPSDGDDKAVVLNMDLFERLQICTRHLSPSQIRDYDVLLDKTWELAWDDYWRHGLQSILQCRPYPIQHVDLLHVLALMICARPTDKHIQIGTKFLFDEHYQDEPAWQKSNQLMTSDFAQYFEINYRHRLHAVLLVKDALVLPKLPSSEDNDTNDDDDGDDDEESETKYDSLFYGALPHLRASLYTFMDNAKQPCDSHSAFQAIVSMTCQLHHPALLKQDWDTLLHAMVDDYTECGYHSESRVGKSNQNKCCMEQRHSRLWPPYRPFCLNVARGRLLADFCTSTIGSRSRRDLSDLSASFSHHFLTHVLSSLTDAIEWQLDCWHNASESPDSGADKPLHSPCLLASLVCTAKSVLPLLHRSDEVYQSEPCDALIGASVSTLLHDDSDVRQEVADLLATAFSVGGKHISKSHEKQLLDVMKKVLLNQTCERRSMEKLLGVVSIYWRSFALALAGWIFEETDQSSHMSYVAIMVANCPQLYIEMNKDLLKYIQSTNVADNQLHLVSCLISSCHSQNIAEYGINNDGTIQSIVGQVDAYKQYKLACHCMVFGKFALASEFLSEIRNNIISEQYLLWIIALEEISQAESALIADTTMGLPSAVSNLNTTLMYVEELVNYTPPGVADFSFCQEFLRLRIDFLDLLVILSQLVGEVRCLGKAPEEGTRSLRLLRKLQSLLVSLASKAHYLNEQFGINFRYGQSYSALQSFQAAAIALLSKIRVAFSESLPVSEMVETIQPYTETLHNPLVSLLKNVGTPTSLNESMSSIDRFDSILETTNAILSVPFPFPRDFFSPRPIEKSTLLLSEGPIPLYKQESPDIDAYTICASGIIPYEGCSFSKISITMVLLWFHISRRESFDSEEKNADRSIQSQTVDTSAMNSLNESLQSPARYRLQKHGRFFINVSIPKSKMKGCYTFSCKLGVRLADGSEWKVPVDSTACHYEFCM